MYCQEAGMAGKKRGHPWGDGMLDDVWEWAAAAGQDTGLALQISLTPTRRRGVWRVLVRALDVVDGRPAGIRLQHAIEWPDATYTTLPAALLQACSYLALRLEEDALVARQRDV